MGTGSFLLLRYSVRKSTSGVGPAPTVPAMFKISTSFLTERIQCLLLIQGLSVEKGRFFYLAVKKALFVSGWVQLDFRRHQVIQDRLNVFSEENEWLKLLCHRQTYDRNRPVLTKKILTGLL